LQHNITPQHAILSQFGYVCLNKGKLPSRPRGETVFAARPAVTRRRPPPCRGRLAAIGAAAPRGIVLLTQPLASNPVCDGDRGAKRATRDVECEDARQSELRDKFNARRRSLVRPGRSENVTMKNFALSQRVTGAGTVRAASCGTPGCLRVLRPAAR
jgi:hypothetical protein